MKKKIYILMVIFFMILNIDVINADGVISGTGGSSGGTTTGGGGSGTHLQNYGYAIHFCSVSSDSCDTYIYKVYSFHGIKGWETPSGLVGWITATQNDKKYTVKTDPTKLYKYLNIPYTGYNGDYQALKNIISDKEIELTTGDYILIEPFTQIDGELYTFRGIVSTSTKVGQYSFHENYKAAAMTLANAAKVGNDIEAGGNTYKAPIGPCDQSKYGKSWQKYFCGYDTNKYIGYGITVVRYDQIYDEDEEYYLDLNGRLDGKDVSNIIGYGTADIYINGELVANDVDDYWTQWPEGTNYEIKNITTRPNKQYNGVYSGSISGTINSDTEVVLNFSSINSCENDFKSKLDGGLTIEERFGLFNTWQRRNLLDFSLDTEEEADEACRTFEHYPSPTSGCMSGRLETSFNSNMLSYYDEIIDINGQSAFCGLTFNISNNIGTSSFPTTKAGMLILNRGENNKTVATGTITKTCYTLYNGNKNIFETNSYIDYISSEKLSLSTDNDSINQIEIIHSEDVVSSGPSVLENGLNRYEITYSANYNLKEWFAKLGSGEIMSSNCSTCRTLGYGIYSKLVNNGTYNNYEILTGSMTGNQLITLYNGNIYFSYEYMGNPSDNGVCTYSLKNEIITNGNDLNLEFRTFQNNNAFPGKDGDGRIVGSNWCYGDNCNSTNALIANVMNNRNDSYNKMKSEPLYRIVLTPSIIKSIREYNKTNPYDDYTLECDANNKCKSKFLEDYSFSRTTEKIKWLEDYEEI